jgi:predicted adenine nucleotide alpha hydrolase (AANH) superfamily ATPase
MQDIVLGSGMARAQGIKEAAQVAALRNFRQAQSPAECKAAAKIASVLLHCRDYEQLEGIALDAKRAGGAIVFSFSDVLREKGFRRAIMISKMRLALQSCRKAGCGFVFCTLAKEEAETRNARELAAFATFLGATPEERKASEETLERLIAFGMGGAKA